MSGSKQSPNRETSWLGPLGFLVAVVTCIAALVVVPEVRQWVGLDTAPNKKEDTNHPTQRSSLTKIDTIKPQSTEQVPKVIRQDKSERVLLLIQETHIAQSISDKMTKQGLSITFGSDIDIQQMEAALQRLNNGEQDAATAIPFAVVITGSTSITPLEPYEGLYSAVANGKLQAISTKNGRTVAFENILSVRGFGNSQEQASTNAIEKASQGISDSFILQVAANSR